MTQGETKNSSAPPSAPDSGGHGSLPNEGLNVSNSTVAKDDSGHCSTLGNVKSFQGNFMIIEGPMTNCADHFSLKPIPKSHTSEQYVKDGKEPKTVF